MMHFIKFSVLVLVLLTPLLLVGQDEVKFGKVDKADLAMTELASDTSAEAYVLYDIADNWFDVNVGEIKFITRTHRRVKLLKRSSFDRADVEISRYKKGVIINKLKAMIHLPNGDKIELKNRDFIKEDENDDYEVIKFTFPQVTEGAIIEYTYTRFSDGWTVLPKYFFQENIPVRWAEHQISIPEYLKYVSLSNASSRWDVSDNSTFNGTFGQTQTKFSKSRYVLKDLRAYDVEDYTNNFMDFIPHIYLQLAGVRFPQQPYEPFLKDWYSLAKELDEMESFGQAFNSTADVRKVLADIADDLAAATTEEEKINAAYQAVTRRIKWNGNYGITSGGRLNKVWESGEGNSAEPNLILLALLREMGVKAAPLLVGLRDRGNPVTVYPIITQFHHTMVLAQVSGKEIILDAGSIYRPIGTPRYRAMNGAAWVPDPQSPRWVDLVVPVMNKTTVAEIDLAEDGMAKVKIQGRLDGYYSSNARNRLEDMDDDNEGPLMRDILSAFPEAVFTSREIDKTEHSYDPLKMVVEFEAPLGAAGDDFIYVSPILIPVLSEGLTDNETRYTPIDFGYAWKERYIAKLKIPAGYAVEELPESVRVKSEDGAIQYLFSLTQGEGEVAINFTVEVGRGKFAADEYQGLREIFQRILDVQESMIVLKKVK